MTSNIIARLNPINVDLEVPYDPSMPALEPDSPEFISREYDQFFCNACPFAGQRRYFTVLKSKLSEISEEERRERLVEEAHHQGFIGYQKHIGSLPTNFLCWICRKCSLAGPRPLLSPLLLNDDGEVANWKKPKSPLVSPETIASATQKPSSYQKLSERLSELRKEHQADKLRLTNEIIQIKTNLSMEQLKTRAQETEITKLHISLGRQKHNFKNLEMDYMEKVKEADELRELLERANNFPLDFEPPIPTNNKRKRASRSAEEKKKELELKKQRLARNSARVLEEGQRAVAFMNSEAYKRSWADK